MKRISDIATFSPDYEWHEPEGFSPVSVRRVDRDYCKQAAMKLDGKPFTPAKDNTAARTVVIDALHKACLSEGHVDRTVAKILAELPRWPDVTDIRQIALETRDIEMRADPKCSKCGGCGFHSRQGSDGCWYSGKCDCWRYVKVAPDA